MSKWKVFKVKGDMKGCKGEHLYALPDTQSVLYFGLKTDLLLCK